MNRIFLLILVSIFTVSTASAQTTFLKKLKKGEKQTVVFYGASAAINTSNRVWVDQLRTRLERRFPEKITPRKYTLSFHKFLHSFSFYPPWNSAVAQHCHPHRSAGFHLQHLLRSDTSHRKIASSQYDLQNTWKPLSVHTLQDPIVLLRTASDHASWDFHNFVRKIPLPKSAVYLSPLP